MTLYKILYCFKIYEHQFLVINRYCLAFFTTLFVTNVRRYVCIIYNGTYIACLSICNGYLKSKLTYNYLNYTLLVLSTHSIALEEC